MQCPVCLRDDCYKKKIILKTTKKPIVEEPNHQGAHDTVHRPVHEYVMVGLDYQTWSQLYADICKHCGTVVRLYIDTKKK